MANLVLLALLGWSGGDAQREKTKSRVTLRDNTTVIWHSKKLYFWINPKKVLNQLNFAS